MHIGDAVRLRDEAARGARGELAGEVGKVGDVWTADGEDRCTVVYEGWGCLIWDAAASDFEPAIEPEPALH